MTHCKTTERSSLLARTSVQLAELTALTQALEFSEGKQVDTYIYIHSKYAVLRMSIYIHAAIQKEKNFSHSLRIPIWYHQEIDHLLRTVCLPKGVAVMHYKGHQKENKEINIGNQAVYTVTRKLKYINHFGK